MTATFSSNESTSLDKSIEFDTTIYAGIYEIWSAERLAQCTQWIQENQLKKVCLQFSDNLLEYSARIFDEIKSNCGSIDVYILGDTSYGSCCVDETAAAHINADSIIHFGHACLSKVTRLPVFYVFPNFDLETNNLVEEFHTKLQNKMEKIVVFYNVGYYYKLDAIKEALSSYTSIKYATLAINEESKFLCWNIDNVNFDDSICVYIGQDDLSFFNLSLSLTVSKWYLYDPKGPKILTETTPQTSAWMRRRGFYIEKCKDAQCIGIVVGTLTAEGYLDVVKHIQNLARNRGIRTYIISVGKVNPEKLANFMEIDCFALIGCPENNIFTSRDFYKPLLSVFEIEMALNPAWDGTVPVGYSMDFRDILPNGKFYKTFDGLTVNDTDVSLITGKIRISNSNKSKLDEESSENELSQNALQERKSHEMMLSNSSNSFNSRSWTGLDPALGQHEPALLEQGRSGIAMNYSEEKDKK